MNNQHEKIKGYRDLSQDEIDLMNQIKEKADEVGELIHVLEIAQYETKNKDSEEVHEYCDQRWLATEKTDLQKGFMSLTRSIAKPESF